MGHVICTMAYRFASMTFLNHRRRSKADHMVVLDIDNEGDDGLFGQRDLKLSGYVDSVGGNAIDLHGISVETLDDETLRFYLVNHRPPVNGTLELDAAKIGANSTVEIFDVARGKGTTEMKWVRTISDEAIYTPNRIASTHDGGFLISNDKPTKSKSKPQYSSRTDIPANYHALIAGWVSLPSAASPTAYLQCSKLTIRFTIHSAENCSLSSAAVM